MGQLLGDFGHLDLKPPDGPYFPVDRIPARHIPILRRRVSGIPETFMTRLRCVLVSRSGVSVADRAGGSAAVDV